MKPIAFNWQNGGGYGNANEGLALSEDHTDPLSRSQVIAVAYETPQQEMAQTYSTPAIGGIREDEMASTIGANTGAGGETQNLAFVLQPVFAIQEAAVRENLSSGPGGMGVSAEGVAYTLEARHHVQAVEFAQNQRNEVRVMDVAGALASEPGMKQQTYVAQTIAFSCKDSGSDASVEISPTLRSMNNTRPETRNGGGQVAIVGSFQQNSMQGRGTLGFDEDGEVLRPVKPQSDHQMLVLAQAFESRLARNGRGAPSDVVPPLKARSGDSGKGDAAPLVMTSDKEISMADVEVAAFTASDQANSFAWERPVSGAMMAQQQSDTSNIQTGVRIGMQVRRLTPRECERLQGFNDDYTLIPHRGKPAADGPRYKALGNSWAVPVVRWVGRRIMDGLL